MLEIPSARFKAVLLKRRGVALGLWGEAGIGKTYQAGVLLQSVPCQTLSIHATASWTSLAQNLTKAKKTPVWAERILERVRRNESVDTNQFLDALTALLATLAPVVLHLEDLHEADAERLEFWQSLAKTIIRMRGVGLLATSRTEPPEPFEEFRLEPLTKEQSDSLLEHEVSATLPKEALEFICSKAAGNPLYTLEYFRHLSRGGFLWNDGKSWHWRKPEQSTMPVTVEALIELALDKVQDEKLEVTLQAKALLPLDTEDALWAEVAELSTEDLETAKLEFRRHSIFNNDSFAHPLYREVTVKNLSKAKRQQLARQALAALQNDPVKAAAFIDDAALENEKALELLQRAAQQARETNDELSAGRFLATAVQYATGKEKGRLALTAAHLLRNHDLENAQRLSEIALLELSHKREALMLGAELLARQGHLTKAEHLLEQSEDTKHDLLAKRLTLRALARDFAGVLELWQDPDLQSSNDPALLQAVTQALIGTHDLEEAKTVLTRALALSNLNLSDQMALASLEIKVLLLSGEAARAAILIDEHLPLVQTKGEPRALATIFYNKAVAVERLSNFQEAATCFEHAAQLYAEAGDKPGYVRARMAAAWEFWHLGAYQNAETILFESRDFFQHSEVSDNLVECEAFLCLLYLDWTTLPIAEVLADKHGYAALTAARQINNPYQIAASLYDVILVKLRQGKRTEAVDLLAEMDDLIVEQRFEGLKANSRYCHALILEARGNKEQALKLLTEAAANNTGTVFYTHKLGLEFARLANDQERALTHLIWFEKCGLVNEVNIAKRYFPELANSKTTAETSEIQPRLDVLGKIQLNHNGKTNPIQGRKRQEFLALLLNARLAGRSEVSRLELLDTLYRNEDELKALRSLKTLTHTLRSSFGETIILTTSTGYSLGAIKSNAEVFLETGDTSLWRGMYLEDLGDTLADTVHDSLYLALFEKAKELLETDPQETARLARFLLLADPYNAAYLLLNLQALQASDNYRTLGRVYDKAKERFAELGEPLPEHWASFLENQTSA